MREAEDVARAKETLAARQEELHGIEQQLAEDMSALESRTDGSTLPLAETTITPRRADITVRLVALAWTPHWQDADGRLTPAY